MNPGAERLDAILAALVAGDQEAADALAAMTDDEIAAVPSAASESVVVLENFTGTITDAAGHKRHYVDGKQVASPGEGGAGGGAGARTGGVSDPPAPDEGAVESVLKDHPHAGNPGFVAKVRAKVGRAMTRVATLLHEAALYSPQIVEAVGLLADTPDDMKKLGYNPASHGGGSHHVADLKDFGPLTTYQAVNLGSMVLAKAYLWAKGKIAGKTEGDDTAKLAALMHEILTVLAEEFGWAAPPDADEMETFLRGS